MAFSMGVEITADDIADALEDNPEQVSDVLAAMIDFWGDELLLQREFLRGFVEGLQLHDPETVGRIRVLLTDMATLSEVRT